MNAAAGPDGLLRCTWPGTDPLYLAYHDTHWGVPLHDDKALFELLILEGFQAGLSWLTILKRREGFRRAFKGFDAHIVAGFTERDQKRLMEDPGIIRNRLKVAAAPKNARAFLAVCRERGSFADYLWDFVDHRPVVNAWESTPEVPAKTPLSDAISKDLKARGFAFVGSTIVYAFMQAAGLVNDHLTGCFRYGQLARQP